MGGKGGCARGGDRRAGVMGITHPAAGAVSIIAVSDRTMIELGFRAVYLPVFATWRGAVNRVCGGAQQLKLEAAVSYGLVVTKDG